MGAILEKTIGYLLEKPELSNREIRSVYLNNYFTVAELDDGSVGACASSYFLSSVQIKATQAALTAILRTDPLLLEHTRPGASADAIARCVRVATAGALSARLLRKHDDPVFATTTEMPRQIFEQVEFAVIIGFGGLLDYIVRKTPIRKIHVSDLSYPWRRAEMERQLVEFRRLRPEIDLSISDGADSADRLAKADFASITGSTLANDTLEPLLAAAQSCRTIVLQGQSASLYPKAFFEAGIHVVATTLKPRDIAAAAFWDATGMSLKPYLERGLHWTYILPKEGDRGEKV